MNDAEFKAWADWLQKDEQQQLAWLKEVAEQDPDWELLLAAPTEPWEIE